MKLNEIVKEVHYNAVEHGFWENERSIEETYSLIHSEWSEALEEDRAGRGLVWYYEGSEKPEGVAIELIDGVIRILDYFGKKGYEFSELDYENDFMDGASILDVVCNAHLFTSYAYSVAKNFGEVDDKILEIEYLMSCIISVFGWIKYNGEDPEKLLMIKHNYNKSRPYKHGKKY